MVLQQLQDQLSLKILANIRNKIDQIRQSIFVLTENCEICVVLRHTSRSPCFETETIKKRKGKEICLYAPVIMA